MRTGISNVFEGTLVRVEPRASRRLTHPALSAAAGGPLPVRQSDAVDGFASNELVEPRFAGVIAVSPETASQLACGDRGYAMLGLSGQSVGEHLWNEYFRWLRQLAASCQTQASQSSRRDRI